jgi:hypothetical protein
LNYSVDIKMKKLILGLDGMDFDIALDLNLKNILQLQFGRIVVPINEVLGQPSSPEVWASFLCGEHVKTMFEGRKRVWLLKCLVKLKKVFPLISMGIAKKTTGQVVGFPKLNKKTWVDLPNVKEINSPYYSYTNEIFTYSKQFSEDKDLDNFKNNILDLYERDTERIISEVKLEITDPTCDVLFAYLHFPDMFNHLWFQDLDTLYSYYQKMDDFVKEVLDLIEDTHVIIVSDHGFDISKGHHSNFGFISSNKFMNFPKDIMELGKLMYEYAGAKK